MLSRIVLVALLANILCLSVSANKDAAPKCGPLEVPNSCVNGGCYKERNCTDISRPTICVDPIKCKAGCLCKDGYLRADNGKCVLKNECPQKKKCPRQNQVYDPCVQSCSPNTCESLNRTYHCPYESANKKCTGGCVCEPGFYKNKIGECVTEEQCKRCSGPNEYYSCGGACDNVCETLSQQNQTSCPIVNIKCNEMCYCVEGYARNGEGICVPFNECPRKEPKCGRNEIYSTCTNGGCFGAQTCNDVGAPVKCVKIDPKYCIKGCKCKDGYVKNDDGKCIREDQCPKTPKCGRNEIYSTCTNGGCFGAQTCNDVGAPVKCVKIDPKYCIKGCKCKDGYVKNDDGKCIREDQCPKKKCTGRNEYYDPCPQICPGRVCGVDPKLVLCAPQESCPPPACICKEGFYRNDNGDCVTLDQCAPQCGKNEVLDDCYNGGCYSERNCTDIGSGYKCVRPIRCRQGCLCKENYLKDKHGRCIRREECPNYVQKDDAGDYHYGGGSNESNHSGGEDDDNN